MKKLNSTIPTKYAYVKNGVIFDIKNYDNGDSCAVKMSESNVDFITINGKTTLYLDNYIVDGDLYEDNKFKKVIHGAVETSIPLIEYYKLDCENEIAKSLIEQYYRTYSEFEKNLDMLGVPKYMIKQGGDTIEPNNIQIDFTESYYDDTKMNETKKIILQSAQDVAKRYGYTLNEPKNIEDLEIEKK